MSVTYKLEKPSVEIHGDEMRIRLISFTTGKHIQFNVPWQRPNDIPLIYLELEHLYQIGELSFVQVEQTKREIMRAVYMTDDDEGEPADRGFYWFIAGASVIVALWGWLFVDSLLKVWR